MAGSDMKDRNTFKVFECIKRSGPLTKKEIQEMTNLSWGSISNNTASLFSAGLISETKFQQGSVGRTPSTHDICDTDNLCIGIDVSTDSIRGCVTSLKCKSLIKVSESLLNNDAQAVVEQTICVLHKLFNSMTDKTVIKGIGVSLPGLVNIDIGEPVFIHQFKGLFPHNFVQIIEKEFCVPTWVFHDTECMMMSELKTLSDAERHMNFLSIRWSYSGIGMSMMLGGNLYRGSSKAAGELGHTIINPDGPLCSCGQAGCLEAYASIKNIVKRVRFGASMGLCPTLKDYECDLNEVDFNSVLQGIDQKDPYILNIVEEAIAYMGIAIANTVNLIDPQFIIIGGEFSGANQSCYKLLKEIIEKRCWRKQPIDLKISNQPQNSAAVGAAEMMVNNIYYNVFDSKL